MTQTELNQLADHIFNLKSRVEAIGFLKGILTPQELSDITQRLQIVKRLKQGMTQRQIAEELGVGIATVTRGSKELQKGRFQHVK